MKEQLKVMIVEDNPADLRLVKEYLGEFNHYTYLIEEAESLEKAVSIMEKDAKCLVLLDLNLPDSNGTLTFEKFANKYPTTAIVVLSGTEDEKVINDLLNLGAQDYLVKGNYSRNELYKTILYAIERNKTRNYILSEKKMFHSTIDSLSAEIAVLDETGRIIYVNKAWADFALNNKNSMANNGLGTNYIEISRKSDDENEIGKKVAKRIEEILEFKIDDYYVEYPCHNENREYWFSAKFTCFEESGKRRIVATHEDITEIRKAEKAYKTSYRIFNHSADMLCIAGFDGYFKTLNPAWEKTLGWSNKELLSKPWINFVHLDDIETTKNIKSEIVGGREIFHFENRYFCKDGSIKWLSWNTFPYPEENIMYGVARDITQKKSNEEHLNKLSSAIEQNPVSIMITDKEGIIEFVNPKFTEMTGYTPEDVKGKTPRILKSGFTPIKSYRELWSTILEGKTWKSEIVNKRKNDDLYWEAITISPILNSENQITHFVSIREDITEKIKLLKDLSDAKDKAESASKLKDAFIANISHEIRTPLNGILGMNRLIQESLEKHVSEEDSIYFSGVEDASYRIIRTIDLIVNYSRIKINEFEINKTDINIVDICKKILSEFTSSGIFHNVKLNMETEKSDIIVHADEYSIIQSVSNLVENAIKYTKDGFVNLKCEESSDGTIYLKVEDSGIGIDEKYLDDLFEPYSQEEMGYGRAYDGLGLGLSLVKNMLDMNEVGISVKSKKGVGTEFTLAFNKKERNVETDSKITPGESTENIEISKSDKPFLLIVEDDLMNQRIMKKILNKNYNVFIADSATGAYKILESQNIEIILMDISISGNQNGLALTTELKNSDKYKDIPIIVITAHVYSETINEAYKAGCIDFIAKPFTQSKFLTTIENVLQSSKET